MSHKTFSIGVLPIVLWKYINSTLEAGTVLSNGSNSSNLPNLAGLPGCCALACWPNITWAWSCRFSIWLESFKPRVSAIAFWKTQTYLQFHKIYVYSNAILIILRRSNDIIEINQSANLVEIVLWLSYRRIQQDQPWQPCISAKYRANASRPLPLGSVYPSWFACGFRNEGEDAATMSRQSIPRSWIGAMIQVEGTTALRSEGKALTRPLLVVSPITDKMNQQIS